MLHLLRVEIIATLALAFAMPALAGGDTRNVTTVTPATFDKFLEEKRQQKRLTLMMFHVGWCKACQRTFPIFTAASDLVLEKAVAMDFAHADCTDDKTLCQRFNVQGYPTIKLFHPDADIEPRNFKGSRTEEGFLKYAQRMTSTPITDYGNFEDFEKAVGEESYSGFVVNSKRKSELENLAGKWMDRHLFAATSSVDKFLPEAQRSKADSQTAITVFSTKQQQWGTEARPSSPAVVAYDGSLDNATALEDWLGRNRFPGLWALNEKNFYEFTHSERPCVLVCVGGEVSEVLEKKIRKAQEALKGEFYFGILDGSNWAEELKVFNIMADDLPRVLYSENNFETWVEDINELRADHLLEDLRRFQAGAPLLRQSRTVMSKILFWKREGWLFGLRAREYAEQGPTQALTVAGGILLIVVLFSLWVWLVGACCRVLFDEEDEPPISATRAGDKKRN
eukprot:TRINITY_DN38193_c0_g1_i1.p1 TRINITY_DN38193_c0_g1~~TRINITY_DN38193_c0_g1_i1.p1  ORF type:complete len:452 (-),score=90.47 TRINITY_DN38193_c0_g1_i1:161-1516(-)